jgi:hypothetical protein
MAKLSAVLERDNMHAPSGGEAARSHRASFHSARSVLMALRPLSTLTCTDNCYAQATPYYEPRAAPPSSTSTPVACNCPRHNGWPLPFCTTLGPQSFPRTEMQRSCKPATHHMWAEAPRPTPQRRAQAHGLPARSPGDAPGECQRSASTSTGSLTSRSTGSSSRRASSNVGSVSVTALLSSASRPL